MNDMVAEKGQAERGQKWPIGQGRAANRPRPLKITAVLIRIIRGKYCIAGVTLALAASSDPSFAMALQSSTVTDGGFL